MLADARGEDEEATLPSEAKEMFLLKRDFSRSEWYWHGRLHVLVYDSL
jgi:hypothetical protein